MNPFLPEPHEAQQLCRLRGLHVKRTRERCAQAQAEVDRALHAVRDRLRKIEGSRREIDVLSHAVVNALAPRLPRWSSVASAQRDRLADRLERDEDALITDEQHLEQAQERAQQARAELTRALAREDAVRSLAQASRRAHTQELDRRAERELEDQVPLSAPSPRRITA